MSEDREPEREHLPCGRPLDDLVEQVFEGRAEALDAHQRGCVHCRAALAESAARWAPLRGLAGRLEPAPPGLVESVMDAVRELAREVWHVVVPGEGGSTRVSATAIARVAQHTASRVPGVLLAVGRHQRGRALSGAAGWVGVAGQRVVVDLALVVRYGAVIPAVADAVRTAVGRELHRLAAVQAAQVDIRVDDVLPPAPG